MNTNIADNFKFIEKIGKGSFGCVYKTIGKENELYACKVENNKEFGNKHQKKRLKGEYALYKQFHKKKIICVPNVHYYVETKKQSLLIMELLGKGIDCIQSEYGGKLDIGSVMKLGITIIQYMEQIHSCGVIHRDIKPNNFMFGLGPNINKLYVMDFGLSKMWCNNGSHIEYRTNRSIIGTPRYASINVHMGIEPSRRDDMESIGYMLIYMATGHLPWQGMKKKSKNNSVDTIGEKKMSINLQNLCTGLPLCFQKYISYTRELGFMDEPDYQYLINLLLDGAKEHNIRIEYMWA